MLALQGISVFSWPGQVLKEGEVMEARLWLHLRSAGRLDLPLVWFYQPSQAAAGMRYRHAAAVAFRTRGFRIQLCLSVRSAGCLVLPLVWLYRFLRPMGWLTRPGLLCSSPESAGCCGMSHSFQVGPTVSMQPSNLEAHIMPSHAWMC